MKRTGFSIVELVITVAVVALLSSIAVARYGNFATNQRVEATTRRIKADLAQAQRRARLSSQAQNIRFRVDLNTYQLPGVADLDHSDQPYVVRLGNEPYRAKLVSVDLGGDAELVFNGFGIPDSKGDIVFSVGGVTRTIDVEADTGRASIR